MSTNRVGMSVQSGERHEAAVGVGNGIFVGWVGVKCFHRSSFLTYGLEPPTSPPRNRWRLYAGVEDRNDIADTRLASKGSYNLPQITPLTKYGFFLSFPFIKSSTIRRIFKSRIASQLIHHWLYNLQLRTHSFHQVDLSSRLALRRSSLHIS